MFFFLLFQSVNGEINSAKLTFPEVLCFLSVNKRNELLLL